MVGGAELIVYTLQQGTIRIVVSARGRGGGVFLKVGRGAKASFIPYPFKLVCCRDAETLRCIFRHYCSLVFNLHNLTYELVMCSCSTKGRASLEMDKPRQRMRWAEAEAAWTVFLLPYFFKQLIIIIINAVSLQDLVSTEKPERAATEVICHAHQHDIACLCINQSGTRVATCSIQVRRGREGGRKEREGGGEGKGE